LPKIDKIDEAIIKFLQQDASLSNFAIAEGLGVSEATVRRRRTRLELEGIIRIAVSVNPWQIGLDAVAIVAVQALASKIAEIEEALRQIPEVHFLGVTTGSYDFMMEVWLESHEDFIAFKSAKIGKIEGVVRVDIFPFLRLSKSFGWVGSVFAE